MLDIKEGMEISHVADLPGRTGLGSSSSFTVGLLKALHALHGDRVTPEDLAQQAIEIERNRIGDPGGHQDQYAAAYGGFARIDFCTDGRALVRKIPVSAQRLRELEDNLMLFFTGVEQSSGDILSEQNRKTHQNRSALKKMCKMVDKAESILTNAGDLSQFGCLLHDAWELKKGLASKISNPMIDDCYTEAMTAGALGGKILGAGGRGFMLLYVPQQYKSSVRAALRKLKEVPLSLTDEGSRVIFSDEGVVR